MKKLAFALVLALCVSLCAAATAQTLQLGTTVNEQDSFQVAAEKFAELVAERTNGEYTIEIYPNGTLGDEAEMLDSMSNNMLDMGIITSGPFVNYSPMMGHGLRMNGVQDIGEKSVIIRAAPALARQTDLLWVLL